MDDIEDICKSYVMRGESPDVLNIVLKDKYKDTIRKDLKSWYKLNRRKMPWRGDSDTIPFSAYGVWVSEVMLQQTRVETVIDYWNRWMEEFPTVEKLAAATPEEVNRLWAGLGYYRRAQNLLAGAKHVMEMHSGIIPQDKKALLDIPGIGPYTAGAISSVAFGKVEPVVDGNVFRVFSRIFALHYALGSGKLEKACWQVAEPLVDPEEPAIYNQALMELGALICKPTNPQCNKCPVQTSCQAFILTKAKTEEKERIIRQHFPALDSKFIMLDIPTDVTYFPQKVEKKKAKEIPLFVHVIRSRVSPQQPEYKYLLLKRPEKGLLANQWEFPTVPIILPSSSSITHEASLDQMDYTPNDECVTVTAIRSDSTDSIQAQNEQLHKIHRPAIEELLQKKCAVIWLHDAVKEEQKEEVEMNMGTKEVQQKKGQVKKQQAAVDYLFEKQSVRYAVEPIVHIFSHERHTMHIIVEEVSIIPMNPLQQFRHDHEEMKKSIFTSFVSNQCCWKTAAEMVDTGITTGCVKILKAVEKIQSTAVATSSSKIKSVIKGSTKKNSKVDKQKSENTPKGKETSTVIHLLSPASSVKGEVEEAAGVTTISEPIKKESIVKEKGIASFLSYSYQESDEENGERRTEKEATILMTSTILLSDEDRTTINAVSKDSNNKTTSKQVVDLIDLQAINSSDTVCDGHESDVIEIIEAQTTLKNNAFHVLKQGQQLGQRKKQKMIGGDTDTAQHLSKSKKSRKSLS